MLGLAYVMLQAAAVVPVMPAAMVPVVVAAVVVAVAVAAVVLVAIEEEVRPVGHPGDYFDFVRSVAIAVLDWMMEDASRFGAKIMYRGSLRLPRRVRVFAMLGD